MTYCKTEDEYFIQKQRYLEIGISVIPFQTVIDGKKVIVLKDNFGFNLELLPALG